jgi:hypothetical protein
MRKFLLCALVAIPVFAQADANSGEIEGVVSDSSNAVIVGATASLVRSEAGFSRKTVSGENGFYRFLLVPPGEYDLEISREGFQSVTNKRIEITVGAVTSLDVTLPTGAHTETLVVTGTPPLVEVGRSQQANTLTKDSIVNLPIDRRDYLTFALLSPGVADSNTIADNTDLRLKPTVQSGLSFGGSNGRGNSVTVDGSEFDDFTGGVRGTLPQEGVQEFQINRSNFSAELGATMGGAINIVSRGGTNQLHGALFDFVRDQSMDARNPFARVLTDTGELVATKPPARRQQFGASLGGPLQRDKTFAFAAFEGLIRRESSVVSILTDRSIFLPTADQEKVLSTLPPSEAQSLRAALTASPSTVALFERNSGVFPFPTDAWRFVLRLDRHQSENDSYFLRYNFSHVDERNANLQSLVGASRGTILKNYDPSVALGWTHSFSPWLVNEARGQFAYRGFQMSSIDPYGPELRIPGYGVFNRDYLLPSINIERRTELRDNVTWYKGGHAFKFGGLLLLRGAHSETDVFFSGRFTFGDLPGTVLDPALPASFTINALQAFNLGLAQTYLQGMGNPVVASTDPTIGLFAQDGWQLSRHLRIDYGLRWELDRRRPPMPTGYKNFGPRFAFAWGPGSSSRTVVRGGYGIYYSPNYYSIDWAVQALDDHNGTRQIASVFTSILTPGPAAANNIYTTLRNQGVINPATPTRAITASDLAQFGITFPTTGPHPPFAVQYGVQPDFRNPRSQQASLALEHEFARDFTLSVSGVWMHTVKLPRSRDVNLLPAPIDPRLGIRVWSDPSYFVDPSLAQRDLFESSAGAIYKGFIVEARKRFSSRLTLNANYTLSKAEDDVTDYNSDFQAADQTNLRAERALSAFDQRHKFVLYGTWQAPLQILLSPIIRANSGRPFNLLAGYDLNQDRHDTTDRPVGAGRNTGIGPDFWTVDLRVSRSFPLGERFRLEFTAEGFNLLNRLNYSSVNNVVGNMPGPFNVTGRDDRLPSQPLGFSSAFDPRRLQLGMRLSF